MSEAAAPGTALLDRLLELVREGGADPVDGDHRIRDSLTAVRVWTMFLEEFGLEIPIEWLEESLAEVAARAGRLLADENASAAVLSAESPSAESPSAASLSAASTAVGAAGPPPAVPSASQPLTELQRAYVVGGDDGLTDDPIGSWEYHEVVVADLDPVRLTEAWCELHRRHDALRLRVGPDGEQSLATDGCAVTVHDLRGRPADAVGQVRDRCRARLTASLGAVQDRALHAVEVTWSAEGPSIVHVHFESIGLDGRSSRRLLSEWGRLYRGESLERTSPAGDPAILDTLATISGRTGSGRAADLEWWIGRHADLVEGPEPFRAALTGGVRSVRLDRTLDRQEYATLRQAAERYAVSPATLVLRLFRDALAVEGAPEPYTLVMTTSLRAYLPPQHASVVGPLTATMLHRVDPECLPLSEAVSDLHARVRADFARSRACGITVARALRDRRGPWPLLPVVFGAMLNQDDERESGFQDDVRYSLGATSGVALNAQFWPEGGGLRLGWDVRGDETVLTTARSLIDTFVMLARALIAAETGAVRGSRALNVLQQGYLVSRLAGDPSGCRFHQAYRLPAEVRTDRVVAALAALVAAEPVLRSHLTDQGGLAELEELPGVGLIELVVADDDAAARQHGRIRACATRAPTPPGRGRHWQVHLVRSPASLTVHLAVDLALADAWSTHRMGMDLVRACLPGAAPRMPAAVGPGDGADPAGPAAGGGQVTALAPDEARQYWDGRLDQVTSVALPTDDMLERPRRLSAELGTAGALREAGEAAGAHPDALVVACLERALVGLLRPVEGDGPTSIVLVRHGDPLDAEAAERTRLSWVTRADPLPAPLTRAAEISRAMDGDRAADQVEALDLLRRRRTRVDLPVVVTSLLPDPEPRLPAGSELDEWVTSTPGVLLDVLSVLRGGRLTVHWDLAPGAPRSLAAAFDHFVELCREALAAPGSGTAGLDPLTRARILFGWNRTEHPYGAEGPAHSYLLARARLEPDRTAVHARSGTLTFGQLAERSERLGRRLVGLGVRRGDRVGVCMRRTPAAVTALLGVLRAGAAYVPIDPALPTERVDSIVSDAEITFVVTSHDTERAGDSAAQLVFADDPDGPSGELPETGPDDLAYVIFTSGSTGRPKGVAVRHRPVHNLLSWAWRRFAFTPEDCVLSMTSFGFDLSVFDLFGVLGRGGSMYLADEEEQRDPHLLAGVLRDRPITFWNSAPTTLQHVLPELESPPPGAVTGLPALRLVFLSGDYTPLTLPERLSAAAPGSRLVSLGGATEATVWSNYHVVDRVDPRWRSIPYGVPIDNARYHVLDESLEPCPVDHEGDLYIGGDCLSDGYVNQPQLTAAAFIEDPFRPGERLYRTGDRASYFADGTLCFRGRVDGQVKVRGLRVELAEVEHAVLQHPLVAEVVVLLADGETLVAYVRCPAGHEGPSLASVRETCAERLPGYMLPNRLVILDRFPATANGKLDRSALVAGVSRPDDAAAAGPDPSDGSEDWLRDLTEIFTGLLGHEIGPDEDIWDAGATSFTMVRASAQLRERRGTRVPVAALVARPTLRGVAVAIAGAGPQPPREEPVERPEPPRPAGPLATAGLDAAEGVDAAGEVDVAGEADAAVDFFDPADRARLKARGLNRRQPHPEEPVLPLSSGAAATQRPAPVPLRRPLTEPEISALFQLLRAGTDGQARRYPSAGNSFAVEAYLQVDDGASGLAPGLYQYLPEDHALVRILDHPPVPATAHFYYNRQPAAESAATIFLVGHLPALEPLYGDQAERYLTLEAGHMAQLLLTGSPSLRLRMIGSVDEGPLRAPLGLGDDHRLLYTALVTPALPAPAPAGGPSEQGVEEITITGLALRFPGADTEDQFWNLLRSGRPAIGPVPAARSELSGLDPRAVGGFLNPQQIDPLRLGMTPAEASQEDPQTLLLLATVSAALRDSGHTAQSLRRAGRVGVYVGALWLDHRLVSASRSAAPGGATGAASALANRISYVLGLDGPSVAVDTACSSSLTAVHLATQGLRNGDCDTAIVCGVNVISHPQHYTYLRDSGLLRDPAEASSTGWTPGEGCGVVLLRGRQAAEVAGDRTRAQILATGVGHAGASGRYGAPNAATLARSISRVVAGRRIDYVELAAAGAVIADSAELTALDQALGSQVDVPAGTVKPLLGHLEAAAGMAQLVRAVLQLERGQLLPDAPGPALDVEVDSRLRPVRRRTPLTAPDGRATVLINAMGALGSHAHALVRHAGPDVRLRAATPVPLLIGADPGRLGAAARRLVEDLLDLMADGSEPRVDDLALALADGVPTGPERGVVWAGDLPAAVDGLSRVGAGGGPAPAGADPALVAAVQRWLVVGAGDGPHAGDDPDWAGLMPQARRISTAWMRLEPIEPIEPDGRSVVVTDVGPSAAGATPAGATAPAPGWSAEVPSSAAEEVCDAYATAAGMPRSRITVDTEFRDVGLSSLVVTEAVALLRGRFPGLSAATFYARRTPAELAAHLGSAHLGSAHLGSAQAGSEPAGSEPAGAPGVEPVATGDGPDGEPVPVAVIGLSIRLPGAPDRAALWRLLAEGRCAVGPVPGDRRGTAPDQDPTTTGGYLPRVDEFDARLFRITPHDAALMDPESRLFLQECWSALEDAGYPPTLVSGQHDGQVGVFAGQMHQEYPYLALAGTPAPGRRQLARRGGQPGLLRLRPARPERHRGRHVRLVGGRHPRRGAGAARRWLHAGPGRRG